MADVITRLKVESSEYDSKLKRAAQSLNQMAAEAQKAGSKINTTSKENIALARELGKMQTVANTAKGKMSELSAAFTDASMHYRQLTDTEKNSPYGRELSKSLEQLKTRIQQHKQELDSINQSIGNMKAPNMGGGMGLSSLTGGALKFAAAMGATTGALSLVTGAIKNNIELAKNFEQANANLASVLGTTRDHIKVLTEDALRLGAATKYTASEVSGLQTELAKLGFSQGEIKDSTGAILDFATAVGTDLSSAAALAGATLRGFGLSSGEMERVVSTMAVGTTKSALSFSYLQNAMSTIAPVAKQFGFSIEDVVALLGTLANSGFDASSAATATRNILLMLADSNSKLSQTLGRPIKSLNDLSGALVELREKGIDLGTMFELTDKRSVAAFATFVDGSSKLKELKESVTGVNDELKAMVEERANTLEGSMAKLSSAWEGFNLALNSSNGIIKDVVDGLTSLISKATSALTEMGKVQTVRDKLFGGGESGKPSQTDYFVNKLKNTSQSQQESLLVRQTAEYNKAIMHYDRTLKEVNSIIRGRNFNTKEALKYIGRGGSYQGQSIYEVRRDLQRRIQVITEERDKYVNAAREIIKDNTSQTSQTTNSVVVRGGKSKGSHAATPQEKAADKYDKALQDYAVSMEKAKIRLESGLDDELTYKKKMLQGEERLFDAYSDAYTTYKDPKYKAAIDKSATKIGELSKEVAEMTAVTAAGKEAERQRAAAAKKVADALERGKLGSNETMQFTITASAEVVDKLKEQLPKNAKVEVTEVVNVEPGRINMPDLPKDGEVTEKVNIEPGRINIPDLPKEGEVTSRVNIEPGRINIPDLPKNGEVTEKVNIEPGKITMPDIPTDGDVTITITADNSTVMQQVNELTKEISGREAKIIIKPEVKSTDFSSAGIQKFIQEQQQKLSTLSIGTDEWKITGENIIDAQNIQTILNTAIQNGLDIPLELPDIMGQIVNGINIDEDWQPIIDQINEKLKEIGKDPIKINADTGKITKDGNKAEKAWQMAADSVRNVGSAFAGIEDPGVKALGTVMQAIASIALGFAQAASAKDTTASGWAWLAWLAAGTAAMATTISTIHSLTGYAQGGIVGGNSYSGDNLRTSDYGINAGELVLTRAQQGNLASQLSGINPFGNLSFTVTLHAEKIRLLMKNNKNRRRKGGEYITAE